MFYTIETIVIGYFFHYHFKGVEAYETGICCSFGIHILAYWRVLRSF